MALPHPTARPCLARQVLARVLRGPLVLRLAAAPFLLAGFLLLGEHKS